MTAPNTAKPTELGGDVGFGKANVTGDNENKYTSRGIDLQWVERTSDDLVALVTTLRSLFPTTPLPAHVQRALARQWSAA